MKPTDFNKEVEEKVTINLLSSKELDNAIKNISRPRFLGSIHLNKDYLNPNYNISSVDNLLRGELELKVNKSLKNTISNPVTKALIVSMIVFNLVWMLLFFLL